MKCDRYIGTGVTSNIQKEGKSVVTSSSPKISPRSTAYFDNTKLKSARRSQVSLFDGEAVNKSRRESLQIPSLINGPESDSTPSPTPSTVLIKKVFSDFENNMSRHDELETKANHCIVIEMHQLKNNNSECKGLEKSHDQHSDQLTTIKEYEVVLVYQ